MSEQRNPAIVVVAPCDLSLIWNGRRSFGMHWVCSVRPTVPFLLSFVSFGQTAIIRTSATNSESGIEDLKRGDAEGAAVSSSIYLCGLRASAYQTGTIV